MVINRDAERLSAEFKNPLIAGERAKSYAFVPMTVGDQVTGLIELQHMDREDAFSDADVRLLQTLAGSMSVALENARLFEETKRLFKAEQQRPRNWPSLAACSMPWHPSCTIKPSWTWWGIRSAASLTHRALEFGRYDHAAGTVDFGYFIQKGRRAHAEPTPFAGMSKYMIEAWRTLVLNENVSEWIVEHGVAWVDDAAIPRSAVYVPLLLGDTVTRVITIQNLDREDAFSDADVRLLQTLAGSMSVALENARLFDEVQKRNSEISEALEQQTATSEILRVIAGSPTDIQPVLDAVAESAARLCESYDAAIALVEGGVYKVVSQWGPVPLPEEIDKGIPINRETVTGRAILEQRSIHVDDVLAELGAEYPLSRGSARSAGSARYWRHR